MATHLNTHQSLYRRRLPLSLIPMPTTVLLSPCEDSGKTGLFDGVFLQSRWAAMGKYRLCFKNRIFVLQVSLFLASLILCVSCKGKDASTQLDAIPSKADSKWQQCQRDTQCVASFGPCGEWVAVNPDIAKEQQAWAIKEGRTLSCPENRSHKPMVGCRDQACTILP